MDNVNFGSGGSDVIENALMDLGPLLGVTIKEEAPEDSSQSQPANNNVVEQAAVAVAGGSGVAKSEESADSAVDAASDARCVFCKVGLVTAEGTPLLMECLHSTCEPCLKNKLERDMLVNKPRSTVPSYEQQHLLVDCLEQKKWLVLGYARTSHARDRTRAAWQEIANKLNSDVRGCHKTWQQWSKYWKDKKSAVKKKNSQMQLAKQQISEDANDEIILSPMEQRIVAVMSGKLKSLEDREPELNPIHEVATAPDPNSFVQLEPQVELLEEAMETNIESSHISATTSENILQVEDTPAAGTSAPTAPPSITSSLDRGASVLCPVCKLQCAVSNMIEQRFVMEKIAADQISTQGGVAQQQCNSCEEHEPATSYCVDCAEFICASCVQAHQRLKITKDHTIKTKEEAMSELQAATGQRRNDIYCRDHPQERLALFCETCERLTCRDCQLQQHRDHRYQFSAEMALQARSSVSSLLSEVSYKRVLLGSAMKVIRDRQAAIADKKRALVHDITATVVKLTNAINTRGKELVLRLNVVCDAKQRTLTEKKEALQQLAEVTHHCLHFADGALRGSDTALLAARRLLLQQLQRVKARRADIPNPDVPVRIALNMDKLPDLLKVVSTIGNIVVDGKVDGGGAAQGPYHPPTHTHTPSTHTQSTIHHHQHHQQQQQQQQQQMQLQNMHAMQSYVSGGGFLGAVRAAHPHVSSTTHPHHLQGMNELNLRGLLTPLSPLSAGGRGASPRLHHHYHHLVGYSQQGGYTPRRASPRAPSPAPPPAYPALPAPAAAPAPAAPAAPARWHTPQLHAGTACGGGDVLSAGGGVDYKISLSRQHAVTSTNPKSPSPLLNGSSMELDAVCAESVRDLMATIAKLDSNGVQVVAERASPAPLVHSSTSPPGPNAGPNPGPAPNNNAGPGPAPNNNNNNKPSAAVAAAALGDPNEDWCAVCMDGGELMCCDKCPKVFHQYCHIPTIDKLPDETETWQCLLCVNFAELGPAAPAHKLMERLTLELYCQYELSLPFREPVPAANHDYYAKIGSPMCLDQIRMKLQPTCPAPYSDVEHFLADCRRVFSNARAYNPVESQLYKDAVRLEQFFEAQLEKLFPEHARWSQHEPPAKRPRN